MTDSETIDKAKALFTGATQGDLLAREVIAIAERAMQKAALWEEYADQTHKELADRANPARQIGPYQYAVATKPRQRP